MNRLLPLCLAPLLLPSCAMFQEGEPNWTLDEVEVLNASVLHQALAMALDDLGYRLDGVEAPGQGVARTLWKEDRHPFQGRGTRSRATIEYELVQPPAAEEGAPRPNPHHALKVAVEVERNMSNRPLDPSYDEWEEAGESPDTARHLLAKIKAYLYDA